MPAEPAPRQALDDGPTLFPSCLPQAAPLRRNKDVGFPSLPGDEPLALRLSRELQSRKGVSVCRRVMHAVKGKAAGRSQAYHFYNEAHRSSYHQTCPGRGISANLL